MELDLLLHGILVPALIAFALSLAPRAAWHGHRADLPAVESWGPAAAISLAFVLAFAHVAEAGDFGSERWHSLASVLLLAGVSSIICWWHTPRAGGCLAVLIAFSSLILLQLPGQDSLSSRLLIASIGSVLAALLLPLSRAPNALAPIILASAFAAMSAAALATGHSKVAVISMSCSALLASLAIPVALNRRFVLGPAAAGVAAAALVALATFGSAYVDATSAGHTLWWWWAAALAPGLSAVPSLIGMKKVRSGTHMLVAAAIVIVALVPGVMASIEHLRVVAGALSNYE